MTDVLIVGSGGAGLTAALKAREKGLSVTVVTKTLPTQAQTCMAQGGINAVINRGLTSDDNASALPSAGLTPHLVTSDDNASALPSAGLTPHLADDNASDTVEAHIADTLKSSHHLADPNMIEQMCQNAAKAIEWLDSIAVPFSRLDNASDPLQSIAQRRLGGASHSRACYAQDYTGLKILHTLYDRCIESGIKFITEHYLLNLVIYRGLTSDDNASALPSAGLTPHLVTSDDNASALPSAGLTPHQVTGATFWDIRQGKVIAIEATNTIIATGGFGELYHGFTTNSLGSSGDGIAAVLRAGGTASDMEFVQFHPTALLDSAILISESARGEGGYLINHEGKRFTDELAPRDEVARAIFSQIQAGHHVRLDIRHLGKEKIEKLMPQELQLCRLHADIDPVKEPIPIMPVAHYTMGGIEVDEEFKVRELNSCYAIGECANAHIHGANRLGGNSLLEIITSGIQVIEYIANRGLTSDDNASALPSAGLTPHLVTSDDNASALPSAGLTPHTQNQINRDDEAIKKIFTKPNEVNFYNKRKTLGRLMYRDVGIIRQTNKLHEAEMYLDEIYNKISVMGVGDKTRESNQNLVEFLEFRNAILLAKCTLKSAIMRQESRGAHYREDFPIERTDWQKHIYCRLKDSGVDLSTELTTVVNDI
ncbi:MAG: FAD-binding protein [Sulfurovum sp.]|nr:FAD-binding protein [Sulfurovum sp.]